VRTLRNTLECQSGFRRLDSLSRKERRLFLSVVVSLTTCLISLLAWVRSVGLPYIMFSRSQSPTNFSFVILLPKVPHSNAQTGAWPYDAQHNKTLRLLVLTPIWASLLSRCSWMLPAWSFRPIFVADFFVVCSFLLLGGISTFYAIRKSGPEQLICLAVWNKPSSILS
jgi:hypothetical protein